MRFSFFARFFLGILILVPTSFSQVPIRVNRGGGGAPGMVALPYSVADNAGNTWMIYQQGWMQQQGNMPLYSQAAVLMINNNQVSSNTNQARLDDKTGEIVFDGMNAAGVTVTRRIQIKAQEGYVRYIDILKNSTPQPITANVQITTSVNYGVQSAQMVNDPRGKDKTFAAAVMLHAGRAIVEIGAGKGAKLLPKFDVQPNANVVRSTMQVPIAAGKQVAILHVHAMSTTIEAASQFALGLKESKILSDVPLELRKSIINVAELQTIGDRELLRGDLFDMLELRGGDQLKGTISEKSFNLQTFYGKVELPAERVVAMFNVGQFKPRQLFVTVDGEVFGGTLAKETVAMQLMSGQTTQVPVAQISRMGYRKRDGEPDEWTFEKPMVHLRSGERMLVNIPTSTVDVLTRYGSLKLSPQSISAIVFQSDDNGVHDILLTDGSKFAGLASADHFDMQLVGTATQQSVSFPSAILARVQFSKPLDSDLDDDDPTLVLSNKDLFVGTLAGELKLDTNFDTITINAAEMRSLTHAAEAGMDVQVTLWDQTTLSGQLRQPEVTCNLKSGVNVKIPLAMVDRYSNPMPQPSAIMVDRIKAIVAELNAQDFKQRDRAEAQLVSMGPVVAGVLKELSPTQTAEAQNRIEAVLRQLEKKPDVSGVPAPGN